MGLGYFLCSVALYIIHIFGVVVFFSLMLLIERTEFMLMLCSGMLMLVYLCGGKLAFSTILMCYDMYHVLPLFLVTMCYIFGSFTVDSALALISVPIHYYYAQN